MPGIDEIINAFGEKLVTDIHASLIRNGVVFGGGQESKLAARTRFTVTSTANGISFNLIMPDEAYWVNKGRKPGPVSKKGRESIADWAKRKGVVGKFMTEELKARKERQRKGNRKVKTLKKLPFDKAVKALTFLIAGKITEKGYAATHFLDEVINDGRVSQFEKDLATALKKRIIVEIKNGN